MRRGSSTVMSGQVHHGPSSEVVRFLVLVALCPILGNHDHYNPQVQWNGPTLTAHYFLQLFYLLTKEQCICMMWIIANNAKAMKCLDTQKAFAEDNGYQVESKNMFCECCCFHLYLDLSFPFL